MAESDEPVRQRKPLRRTSLTLLIGGAVALCLMIAVQLVLLAGGEDVGPGRPGVLPAGEQVSVHTYPRLTPGNRANTPGCEVHGPDGKRTYRWLEWGESFRSSTRGMLQCEQEAILLTGAASAVVSAVRGSLFGLAITAMVVGLLLFFPRFTLAGAR